MSNRGVPTAAGHGPGQGTEVLTPTFRRATRRSLFWLGAGVIALLVAFGGLITSSTNTTRDFLDPANAAPEGAKALVEVLRARGVTVRETASLGDTERAITSPESTTLVFFDRDYLLTPEQRRSAFALAHRVVIIDPGFDDLMVVAPHVANAGVVDGTVTADCQNAAVLAAEIVTGTGTGLRVITPQPTTDACLGSGDGVFSLVTLTEGERTFSLLGTSSALSNEFIAGRGNAAYALTLLGAEPNLVWYIPGLADSTAGTPPTLGELSPPWVTSVAALLALTALAAAIWRGRRFGPLVIENLPVVVRSHETTQGRARLYEKNSARLHSLDALRLGTLSRLAVRCGLARTATVDTIIATVAALTGRDPATVRHLLIDANPANDRELVALSDQLLELETSVELSVRPASLITNQNPAARAADERE